MPHQPALHLLMPDPALDERAESLLTTAEREALAQYRFPKRRRDWLLGRLAAKSALAEAGGWPPEHVAILRGEKGCPTFAGPDDRLAGWKVSITHGHGCAAAAAAPGPVGVDLERLRSLPENGWRFFLNEREREWLAGEPLGPHGEIVVWALKEAVYKALEGMVGNVLALEVAAARDGAARLETPQGTFEGRYRRLGELVLAIATPEGATWLEALGLRLFRLQGVSVNG